LFSRYRGWGNFRLQEGKAKNDNSYVQGHWGNSRTILENPKESYLDLRGVPSDLFQENGGNNKREGKKVNIGAKKGKTRVVRVQEENPFQSRLETHGTTLNPYTVLKPARRGRERSFQMKGEWPGSLQRFGQWFISGQLAKGHP